MKVLNKQIKLSGNNVVFIIGMRRSGTSILKNLVERHQEVGEIKFEPHELLFSAQTIHIKRYSKSEYHKKALNQFCGKTKWTGAKIALNAGIEAMNWKWLEEKYENPHYIFIKRKCYNTYQSWIKNETSVRGICPYNLYSPWWEHINKSFNDFVDNNPQRSCMINYDNMLINPDIEFNKIRTLLNLSYIDISNKIRKPKGYVQCDM